MNFFISADLFLYVICGQGMVVIHFLRKICAKVHKKSHICKHMQDFRSFFSHFLCIGVPRVNQRSVCYGESVEQYVALHKGCARNRASISSSASVFLHMVETQREDLKDDFVQNFHPVFFFAFSFHIRS